MSPNYFVLLRDNNYASKKAKLGDTHKVKAVRHLSNLVKSGKSAFFPLLLPCPHSPHPPPSPPLSLSLARAHGDNL